MKTELPDHQSFGDYQAFSSEWKPRVVEKPQPSFLLRVASLPQTLHRKFLREASFAETRQGKVGKYLIYWGTLFLVGGIGINLIGQAFDSLFLYNAGVVSEAVGFGAGGASSVCGILSLPSTRRFFKG